MCSTERYFAGRSNSIGSLECQVRQVSRSCALVPIWKSIDEAWVWFELMRIHHPSRTIGSPTAATARCERIVRHGIRNSAANRNKRRRFMWTSKRQYQTFGGPYLPRLRIGCAGNAVRERITELL